MPKEITILEPGTRVRTTQENPSISDTWAETARAERKWGVQGVVSEHLNSHGLCYLVYHEDKTSGWYDPSELELV